MVPKSQGVEDLELWQCMHSNVGSWNWQCCGLRRSSSKILGDFYEAAFILKHPPSSG
jgi:hypothetical protein